MADHDLWWFHSMEWAITVPENDSAGDSQLGLPVKSSRMWVFPVDVPV